MAGRNGQDKGGGKGEGSLMLDQAIRYGSILSQPEYDKNGIILEIGCGTEGITGFTDEQVIGIDVRFDGPVSRSVWAVRASVASLPFRNASFNRVVCSDVMEHLPEGVRPRAVDELLRVTKESLFLACPCGDPARRLDGFFLKLYNLFKIPPPDWMVEHGEMGIPDADSIRSSLHQSGASFRELSGESWVVHFFVTLLISLRVLNNLWRKVFQKKGVRAGKLGRIGVLSGRAPYRKLWVVNLAKSESKEG